MFSSTLFIVLHPHLFFFFFFNHPAPTQIYTLSLHDALPISDNLHGWKTCRYFDRRRDWHHGRGDETCGRRSSLPASPDRKSTRLNSSHVAISYAVFCLKKKKKIKNNH